MVLPYFFKKKAEIYIIFEADRGGRHQLLLEVLEKMKKSFKDKDALKDNGEFQVFKGKTYTNRARIWFMSLLNRGVSSSNLPGAIQDAVDILGVRLSSTSKRSILPSRKLIGRLQVRVRRHATSSPSLSPVLPGSGPNHLARLCLQIERMIINEQFLGTALKNCPVGMATAHGDGGKVKGNEGYAMGLQLQGADGVGDKPIFVAAGIARVADGMAATEHTAFQVLHEDITNSYNGFAELIRALPGTKVLLLSMCVLYTLYPLYSVFSVFTVFTVFTVCVCLRRTSGVRSTRTP